MSIIQQTLIAELQTLFQTATSLKEKIEKAKTKSKKEYYYKKLYRNNNIAADVLIALERIKQYKNSELQKFDFAIKESPENNNLPDEIVEICKDINDREQDREYNDESSETIT